VSENDGPTGEEARGLAVPGKETDQPKVRTRHTMRRNGAIALVLLAAPWAWVLVQAIQHHHLDSGAVSIVFGLSVGLPALWLAWVGYQEANRSGTRVSERSSEQPRDWRGPVASLLIVAGCVLAPVSLLAVWTANQVSDTGRYVANVAPLIQEPAIQNALTDKITTAITTHLNAAGYTGFIQTRVHKIVTSPQAANLWIQINRTSHDQLIKVLSGQDNSAISTSNFQVNLDLGPFVNVIKQDLVKQGFTVIGTLPPIHPTIALFSSKNLVQAQTLYQLITDLKYVLPVLTLLFLGLGVYLATRHRRALIASSLGVAASMLVLGIGLQIGRGVYINSVPAAALYDTLVRFIGDGLRLLFVLGLIVAIVAFFTGPAAAAVGTRRAFRAEMNRLRSGAALTRVQASPVGEWTYDHRMAVRIGTVILAAIIFVFWPSVVSAIVLAVVLLLVLGLVALISERPTPPRRNTISDDTRPEPDPVRQRNAVLIGTVILAGIIFVFWPSVVSAIVLAVVLLLVLGLVALTSERPTPPHRNILGVDTRSGPDGLRQLQDHPGAVPDSPRQTSERDLQASCTPARHPGRVGQSSGSAGPWHTAWAVIRSSISALQVPQITAPGSALCGSPMTTSTGVGVRQVVHGRSMANRAAAIALAIRPTAAAWSARPSSRSAAAAGGRVAKWARIARSSASVPVTMLPGIIPPWPRGEPRPAGRARRRRGGPAGHRGGAGRGGEDRP
jgi:hypothetical protein